MVVVAVAAVSAAALGRMNGDVGVVVAIQPSPGGGIPGGYCGIACLH